MTDTPNPSDGSSPHQAHGTDGADSTSDEEASGGATGSDVRPNGGRRKAPKQHTMVRRHWLLASFALVLALLAGTTGSYLWYLNHQIGNIDRVDAGITEDPNQHDNDGPLNILLLGADNGDHQTESVADDMADGKWTPFEHRSDTMMIAHIPADRKSVQLISIPRDTWVKIDGYPYTNGYGKINGAFAYGGPRLARETVERLTGIHMDHLAIIDWAGFKDLTGALGGIRVYIPETFYDDSQRITWEQGWHDFQGQEALAYVRTRHGLQNGDFDRIKRQQNFLRATMSKLLSGGTTRNPIRLSKVVGVITRYLTVDDTWSNGEIRDLALSMRNIHTDDVTFLTAPLGSYDTSPDGQSIVKLSPSKSRALFSAVEDDDIERYLERYPKARLGNQTSIN